MKNPNDVFWLARYAHNQLAPLFDQAKLVEPSIQFDIAMEFSHPDAPYTKKHAVSVTAHWKRPGMFLQSYGHTSEDDIDMLTARVRKDVEALQADALADALVAL